MSVESDIVVIGGGIAGLTAARALARSGARVRVVEKGELAAGTSRVAAGMLAPFIEARMEERETLGFGVAALDVWKRFAETIERESGRSIDYRADGTILTGVEPDHAAQNRHLSEEYRALGLAIDALHTTEARALEPLLSPRITDSFLSRSDHQVDPRALLAALIAICRDDAAVDLHEREEAVRLTEVDGGGWRIELSEGRSLVAPTVVLATGASLSIVRDLLPGLSRSVRPVKGTILRIRAELPAITHVIRTPEVYIAPKEDGTIVVGATSEDRGFESLPRLGPLFEILRAVWETIPSLYDATIEEIAVGHRPATIDHAPLIGPTSRTGLLIAGGYYRHGILFAPLAAEIIARYVQTNEIDERYERFSPERFERHD